VVTIYVEVVKAQLMTGCDRILKFSESSYSAPPYIKSLEDQGKRGDQILMRGLHTGAAVITVRPSDPVYKVCSMLVRIVQQQMCLNSRSWNLTECFHANISIKKLVKIKLIKSCQLDRHI